MYRGPRVLPAGDLLEKALHRAGRVTKGGQTRLHRERATAIARLRTAADILAGDLEGYVKGFPSLDRLHPFHRELAGLVVNIDRLKHALGAADWCAAQVRRVAAEGGRRIARAPGLPDLLREKRAVYGRVTSLVKQIGPELEVLVDAAVQFRRLPTINPEEPTVVIAGAPNVGKSQLVRAMSSGKPEVAPYPFTTKALSVGHFEHRDVRFQVIDTPGLLDRPMAKRNPVERQAVAALRHLAHVIVFLLDPTETCGTPLDAQERLLASLREELPQARLLEVENKADLVRRGTPRRRVSAKTKAGADGLRRNAAEAAMESASAPLAERASDPLRRRQPPGYQPRS